jgi:hypothetical protein
VSDNSASAVDGNIVEWMWRISIGDDGGGFDVKESLLDGEGVVVADVFAGLDMGGFGRMREGVFQYCYQ